MTVSVKMLRGDVRDNNKKIIADSKFVGAGTWKDPNR